MPREASASGQTTGGQMTAEMETLGDGRRATRDPFEDEAAGQPPRG